MPMRTFSVRHRAEPVLRLRPPVAPAVPSSARPNANDQFKRSWFRAFAVGLIVAPAIHVALFRVAPAFEIEDVGTRSTALASIDVPPVIEIPAPPEVIARPARPRLASIDVSEAITIAPTTFSALPSPADLAPPTVERTHRDGQPSFIPYDTPPTLENGEEAANLLELAYPRHLREAGIGGRVRLWLHVDERGAVQQCLLDASSGQAALDEIALEVAHVMRFTPARNRDKVTAVWIAMPIDFVTS